MRAPKIRLRADQSRPFSWGGVYLSALLPWPARIGRRGANPPPAGKSSAPICPGQKAGGTLVGAIFENLSNFLVVHSNTFVNPLADPKGPGPGTSPQTVFVTRRADIFKRGLRGIDSFHLYSVPGVGGPARIRKKFKEKKITMLDQEDQARRTRPGAGGDYSTNIGVWGRTATGHDSPGKNASYFRGIRDNPRGF